MADYKYHAALVDLDSAPQEIQTLLDLWDLYRAENKLPLKRIMNPADFKTHLGRICIIEVLQQPLDFIYRLDGTEISATSNEDLHGLSILDGTPSEVYQNHFQEFKITLEAAEPRLWHVSYTLDPQSFEYLRLMLPFTRDDETAAAVPDFFMTYCYSLSSSDGSFPTFRHLSSHC
ncbi:PAS domain-containing protein [Kiloniella laminariae]|uniref:PAS domain-containing protein n=1 Tax=Kiloniella laminariae TaxID=454162 RepID=UPI00035D48BF|nr:PAS domain-containing protein [Kiloniella laminariae]